MFPKQFLCDASLYCSQKFSHRHIKLLLASVKQARLEIYYAIAENNSNYIDRLLRCCLSLGQPVLHCVAHWACAQGHSHVLKTLLKRGLTIVYLADKQNMLLLKAIHRDRVRIIKFFMKHGIYADNCDIALASAENHTNLVLFFIKQYYHNMTDFIQCTLVQYALDHKNAKIINRLLQYGLSMETIRKLNIFYIACSRGYDHIVKVLLKHNLPLEDIRADMNAALLVASSNRYTNIVKLLLQHGLTISDIRCRNDVIVNTVRLYEFTDVLLLFTKHGLSK